MTTSFLDDARTQFRKYKIMAERAMDQVDDAQFFDAPAAGVNSIAVQAKHLSGNMRSRFTDFLTTDGEKPDRARDTEFEVEGTDRAALMDAWEAGWVCLFAAVDPLRDDDLSRGVQIRGVQHSVLEAVNRQLTHYAYHVGQIVLLAKWHAGQAWQTLSVPLGESEEWNRKYWGKP